MLKEYEKAVDSALERTAKVQNEINERKLKFRKIKSVILTLATSAALAGVSIGSYKLGQKNPIKEEAIITQEVTCDIFSADADILETWANYEMAKYSEATTIQNNQEAYNSMYTSYFMPVEEAYNDYLELKTEESKLNLQMKARILENELRGKHNGESYSFDRSPFKYAVIEDNMVLVPYNDDVKNGNLDDGIKTVQLGSKLYRVVKIINAEEDNSLHM